MLVLSKARSMVEMIMTTRCKCSTWRSEANGNKPEDKAIWIGILFSLNQVAIEWTVGFRIDCNNPKNPRAKNPNFHKLFSKPCVVSGHTGKPTLDALGKPN